MTVALPACVAQPLILRVEAGTLEQALGQAQRHGGVVRPVAGCPLIRVRRAQPITDREPEKRTEKACAQTAQCGQSRRLGAELPMTRPSQDELGLFRGLWQFRPARPARALP